MPEPRIVLVVEDELPLRRLMARMLERHGYQPVLAANGLEALEHLHRGGPPHAALVDLMMPVMDGETFATTVRAESYTFPIILVSASPEAGDVAARLGVDYIAKPYDFDVLIERLELAIRAAAA